MCRLHCSPPLHTAHSHHTAPYANHAPRCESGRSQQMMGSLAGWLPPARGMFIHLHYLAPGLTGDTWEGSRVPTYITHTKYGETIKSMGQDSNRTPRKERRILKGLWHRHLRLRWGGRCSGPKLYHPTISGRPPRTTSGCSQLCKCSS